VKLAEDEGCDLPDLSLEQMQKVHGSINLNVYQVLGVYNSTASRASYGGTSPNEVRKQIKRWVGEVG